MASNPVSKQASRRLYGRLSFITAVFALSCCTLTLLLSGQRFATAMVIACLLTLLVEQLRRKKVRQIEEAASSADRSLMNEIFVNGVRIGEINDADFFALKLDTILDARNYVAQLVALASFLLRCAFGCAVFVPVALFWWFVLGAGFAPAQTLTALAPFYHLFAQAPTIAAAVPMLQAIANAVANVGAITFVIYASLLISFSKRPPVRNAFRDALHWRLRRFAHCAVEGNLHVETVPATTGISGAMVRRTRTVR